MIKNPVIATKANGKIDWMQYARWWPIVAGIIVCAFWLGGRLESPLEKQQRINSSLSPIMVRLDHIEAKIDGAMTEQTEILRDLADAVVKYVDYQTGAPR